MLFSISRVLTLVLAGWIGSTVLPPGQLFAQETSDESSLLDLFRQWKDLDQELASKQQAFQSASDPDQQEDIRGQYESLLAESRELVSKIRSKANATLDSGTPDPQACRMLIGIIMNDTSFNRDNEAIQLGDKYIAAGGDGSLLELAAKSDRLAPHSKELLEELFVRYNQKKQDDLPQVKVKTSKGEMTFELFEDEAPNAVANFVSLVENEFYNGLTFHRVVEGFVAQGGCPKGDGSGGPGYTIKCECTTPEARQHFQGSLSMAHRGLDTGGSQFFICLGRTSELDGRHTVFGRVIDGIGVLERLTRNHTPYAKIKGADADTIQSMEVIRKRDHEYKPVKVGEEDETKSPETPPVQPETMKSKTESTDSDQNEEMVSGVGSRESGVGCQVSGVRCQVSGVRCQVSGVEYLVPST